jgi:3-methylcrotonyl-CoA carboxylase alpha subunit
MKSVWRDGDRVREVELKSLGAVRYAVNIDGAAFEVAAELTSDGRLRLTGDTGTTVAEVTAAGTRRFVRLGTLEFVLDREASGRRAGAAAHGGMEAPMPGVITKVMVEVGAEVEKGQPLVALEAMKMEHMIRAPRAGKVKRIAASPGQMVQAGVALVELEG